MDTTQTPPHGVSRHPQGFQIGRSQVVQWHHVAVCVQGFGRAAVAGPVGDLARRHVLLVPDCQPPVAQVVRAVGGTFTTLQARDMAAYALDSLQPWNTRRSGVRS
jgi:hypothetical protein